MDSNTENVSGAQTNAERSRPRALPEALEAFVCTFQKRLEVVVHKAERQVGRQIDCFTEVTTTDNLWTLQLHPSVSSYRSQLISHFAWYRKARTLNG